MNDIFKKIFSVTLLLAAFMLVMGMAAHQAALAQTANSPAGHSANNVRPLWQPLEYTDEPDGYPHMDTDRFIFKVWQVFTGDEKSGRLSIGALVFLPHKVTHKIFGDDATFDGDKAPAPGRMPSIVGSDRGDTLSVMTAELPAFANKGERKEFGHYTFSFVTGTGDDLVDVNARNLQTTIALTYRGGNDLYKLSGYVAARRVIIYGDDFAAVKPGDISVGAEGRVTAVVFATPRGKLKLVGADLDKQVVNFSAGGSFIIAGKEVKTDPATPAYLPERLPTTSPDSVAISPKSIIEANLGVLKDLNPDNRDGKGKTHIVAWGDNSAGQLGTGKTGNNSNFAVVATKIEQILQPDFKVLQLSAAEKSYCLLRSDKTVWCWGDGYYGPEEGQFGPLQITGIPAVKELVGSTSSEICATTDADEPWCWTGNTAIPARFVAPWANNPELRALSDSFSKVFLSRDSGCGVTKKGEAWCWPGQGSYPVQIKISQPVESAALSGGLKGCALLADHTISCWDTPAYPRTSRGFYADGKFLMLDRNSGREGVHGILDMKPPDATTAYGDPAWLLGGDIKVSTGATGDFARFWGPFACALEKSGAVWCWNGETFGGIHFAADTDLVQRVRGPDPRALLDHVTNLVASKDGAVAIVEDRNYELVPETDPVRTFYALVYSRRFAEAKALYKEKNLVLTKDDPLAPHALIKALEFEMADIIKAIADTGIDLELTGFGESALWRAIKPDDQNRGENLPLLVLLAYGVDPETHDFGGLTPLKYMQQWDDERIRSIELLKAYIKNGRKLTDADMARVKNIKMGDTWTYTHNIQRRAQWIRPEKPQPAPQAAAAQPAAASAVGLKPEEMHSQAYIRPCSGGEVTPAIRDYDVVFRGKAVVDEKTGRITFDEVKTYKGLPANAEQVVSLGKEKPFFATGDEAIVFAQRSAAWVPWFPACTPVYKLDKAGNLDAKTADMLVSLEMYYSQLKGAGIIDDDFSPQISHYVLSPGLERNDNWEQAAKLLEDHRDYERAIPVYEALLAKTAARSSKQSVMLDDCENSPPEEDTREFLKFGNTRRYLFGYGRALVLTGRYKDALLPLCAFEQGGEHDGWSAGEKGESFYRTQAMMKLGHTQNLDGRKLDLSDADLSGIDLSGLDIERSNFSNARLANAKFNNAKLGGANFENSKLYAADFTGADLIGANFKSASIGAALSGATLRGAIYDSKTVWPPGFDPVKAGAKPQDQPVNKEKFAALPSDFDVVAVGVYRGKYKDRTHAGGSHPRGNLDLAIRKTPKPVVLVLASYEPVDWHIHLDDGVMLGGIIVSGMYDQNVFGVPGDIQVLAEYKDRFYGPFDEEQNAKLKAAVLKITGKNDYKTQTTYETGTIEVR